MSEKLFEEFQPASSKEWKQKIQVDLKGADYNETLIWNSLEGLHIKPFYTKEDVNIENTPNTKATSWKICQTIFIADVKRSNEKAIELLNKGVDAIKFIIPSKDVSIEELLKDISNNVTLYFELQFISSHFVKTTQDITKDRTVFVSSDIIGNLAKTGNWYSTLNEDHNELEAIFKSNSMLSVDASLYQNAGANIVQQLAYVLAHTNEYLNHFQENLDKNVNMTFHFSVGSNYFFEIAKLRAFRILFRSLASEYGINQECHIIATPSKRNKTLYDYNTNLLRTTTEYMSAVLGGANSVNTMAYDEIYHKTNEFAERIARNQLLVLKHESYFDYVDNPSDGAYYIEELTTELSEKALQLFKDIEASGGFLKQLKEGTIQKKIKESAHKEQALFDKGKLVLLGSNKHPNPNDRMKDELQLYPFVKQRNEKTLIEPIVEKRLAETYEQERLKTE